MRDELEEITSDLAEYYSSVTGRNIMLGVGDDLDIWLSSNRTHGKEYFESIAEVTRRIELLYSDLLEEDDSDFYVDGIEGF